MTSPKQTKSVPLHLLKTPMRPQRAIDADIVDQLARSIERIGLRTPITVRAVKGVRDGREIDAWELVSGQHRVAAVRRLGWSEIEAVLEDGPDGALWSIAENLHRADLSPADRGRLIEEWLSHTGQRGKVLSGTRSKPGRPPGGLRQASRDLGIPFSTAKDAVRAAKLDSNPVAAVRDGKPRPASKRATTEMAEPLDNPGRDALVVVRDGTADEIRAVEESERSLNIVALDVLHRTNPTRAFMLQIATAAAALKTANKQVTPQLSEQETDKVNCDLNDAEQAIASLRAAIAEAKGWVA